MTDDFDGLKRQVASLAEVVNAFESEAVQLRIIEALLHQLEIGQSTESTPPTPQRRPKKGAKKQGSKKAQSAATDKPKRRVSSGAGPTATVAQLAAGDFFNEPRAIGDIVQHCKDNLARTFRPNEISGKLARMVREGELIRKKNADNQYEYTKP